MTDNLPAVRTGFGPADTPLSAAPTAALAFALGAAVSRPQSANTYGPFCAMVEELMRRPVVVQTGDDVVRGSAHATNVFDHLLSLLPPEVARSIAMLYQMQRGQRWNATGTRHGTTPTNTGNR